MFKKEFKIVEIRDNGVVVTHYLIGKKAKIEKDIKLYKDAFRKHEMFENGMVVWD